MKEVIYVVMHKVTAEIGLLPYNGPSLKSGELLDLPGWPPLEVLSKL